MDVNNAADLKRFIALYNNVKNGTATTTAILVKYYLDGCRACIEFQDEWNKVKHTSRYKHVQFVKLNYHYMNKVPIPNATQFPTVRLITRSGIFTFGEDPTTTRTVKNLQDFVFKYSGQVPQSNTPKTKTISTRQARGKRSTKSKKQRKGNRSTKSKKQRKGKRSTKSKKQRKGKRRKRTTNTRSQ